jgi:hypothetical protein
MTQRYLALYAAVRQGETLPVEDTVAQPAASSPPDPEE